MSDNIDMKNIPSLWEAAKQEMEGYSFLGDYVQPKWDVPEIIGISCAERWPLKSEQRCKWIPCLT